LTSKKKTAVAADPRLPAADFRRRLITWYREHARELPWRGIEDPYATWVSEIMLQQTRVATVVERYQEFIARFPSIQQLAAADVDDVLALWSGLGYYRRARMLHRAAQFVVRELAGVIPSTSTRLRLLPGVGEYTAAAIASLAFGESVAVVDGNVERVLLRVIGEAEDHSSAAHKRLTALAQQLVPAAAKTSNGASTNPPGEHNQAMMELGATICLPRAPMCLQCPIFDLCRTRGEHVTVPRTTMRSQYAAYLLGLRKSGVTTEILLEQRSAQSSLMPGMLELPPLPADAVDGIVPALRLRHAITTTNYLVEIFTEGSGRSLQNDIPAAKHDLRWVESNQLARLPLTGLTRKVLLKLKVMERRRSSLA
jgi:A/G-specific adenine glycosylase